MVDAALTAVLITDRLDSKGGRDTPTTSCSSASSPALGVPEPQPASGGTLSDYQSKGPVPGGARGGGTGFIDLYKHNCFILEA